MQNGFIDGNQLQLSFWLQNIKNPSPVYGALVKLSINAKYSVYNFELLISL